MNKKSLIIVRGLPGSGKSTLCNLLSENGLYPVYSIDDYFTNPDNGNYQFDYTKNHLAYKTCEENTRQSMQKGISKIFLDHTFTLEWEMEPYFKMASEFQYQVFVLTLENRHGGKNIHGISDEQIMKMAEKFQVKLLTS